MNFNLYVYYKMGSHVVALKQYYVLRGKKYNKLFYNKFHLTVKFFKIELRPLKKLINR